MSTGYNTNSGILEDYADQLEKACTAYDGAQDKLVKEMKKPTFTGAGGDSWQTVITTAETEFPKFTAALTDLVAELRDSASKNTDFDNAIAKDVGNIFG